MNKSKTAWRVAFPTILIVGSVLLVFGSSAAGGTVDSVPLLKDLSSRAAMDMPLSVLAIAGLIALSTLVSEDLTCIGTGLMVAQGRVSFSVGTLACLAGIFVGDLLLFLAGRFIGRPALRRAPLKWFLVAEDVDKSSAWLSKRAAYVIAASRFVPGARLPTYFAAGALNTRLWRFALYFLLAGAVWTPLLVGASKWLGAGVIESALLARYSIIAKLAIAAVTIFAVAKLVTRLSTHKGRRLLLSSWKRLVHWEFWPPWVFYAPVAGYILLLAVKHRSLTVFTVSNPAIPTGGFVGESKINILRGLRSAGEYVATADVIAADLQIEARIAKAQSFLDTHCSRYPVVLKPDAGERGSGVVIAKDWATIEGYLETTKSDTIIQEFAPGAEFGVFYYRKPEERKGRIFSITEKRLPAVTGDGLRTLEQLILDDDRTVCMARFLLNKHRARLTETPTSKERIQVVELGTHCKGAVFLNGSWVKTAELEDRIDQISRTFSGFYFGRFDIRTPAVEDFRKGLNFKIVELNGVTSESTDIYDPNNRLLDAYRVLFRQWSLAFEIGAANRRHGFPPATMRELWVAIGEHRKRKSTVY